MINREFSNIKEVLDNSVKSYPENNAFIIKNKDKKTYTNITYQRLQNEINQLGTALLKIGLKGKRIAIIGKNRYEWAVSYYAIVNGLGIVIPLDKGLPKEEIELSLRRSKADAIIFEDKYLDIIKEIVANGNINLSKCICMDEIYEENILPYINLLKVGENELKNGYNEYLKLPIDNEATNIILFTSGTTDLAKAVELSHKNIASNINGLLRHEKIYSTDVNMAFLPFHHTFGCTGLLYFMSVGATTVFCDGLKYVAKNLKEYKVSVFFCVPLIIEAMHKKVMQEIHKKEKDKTIKIARKISKFLLKFKIDIRRLIFKDVIEGLGGNIRFVISGAAALDKQVEIDFNDFGILTVQGYGLTETSPVLCAENEYWKRPGSIGKPLFNVEMKIDNPDENGIGEIIAKGPNVMKCYYENEEATKTVFNNGWFRTGDLGHMDDEGYFYISGRDKNVIVLKNGKNVYPEEIEVLISNLPYVVENIVFGLPKNDDLLLSTKIVYDKKYIQENYSNITEEKLKEIIWKDIKEQVNSKLTNFKHIKNLIITDEPMIKTTTNKVKRKEEIKKILK